MILGVFVTFTLDFVWTTMWVNRLTHIVTRTAKGAERFRKHQAGGFGLPPGAFSFLAACYMTCSMKLPIVFAASSCFCRVAWV